MAKTIVWMSRHSPLVSQLKELERLFPGHSLIIDRRAFSSAAQIVQRFHEALGDEMVVVAPDSVVRELIRLGIRPIYAEMQQVSTAGEAETTIVANRSKRRRYYRFVKFHYCVGIPRLLEPIPEANASSTPTKAGSTVCSHLREWLDCPDCRTKEDI